MKKSLFALAAVTAFAGAAQAQSSVTVYGILDVGYVGGNERLAGVRNANTNGSVTNQNFSLLGASAQSTSRLGFRGREDLGGGTAAFFTLEMEVTPNSSASPLSNNRNAFVGLSQKGIGQASIGLVNTLVTDAISPTIAGQFNNIVGSMLFPGGVQGTTRTPNFLSADATTLNRVNGNNEGFTFRTSNTLKLQSERMAGLQASAMWVQSGATSNQGPATGTAGRTIGYTGGKDDQTGWGLGLNYTYKKAIVTAAYQSLTATDPYSATAAEVRAGGIGATPGAPAPFGVGGATGSNIKDNQAYVGATYDFGILKAYAGWINRKVTSQINANTYLNRTAQEIGVRGNWTPKIESWASVGNGRVTAFGNSSPTANIVGWQIGSNYILSKRTNLYAIYGQNGTSNASAAPGGNPVSYNSNQYAAGVRHTF
jgi:predicted porin